MTDGLQNQTTLPDLKLKEVEKLEQTVHEGMSRFIEVGKAIIELRDRNGWKARGYKTPEEYFQKTFGFGERQALRLADGFTTSLKIEAVTGDKPRNEFSARVLKPIANDPKLITRVQNDLKKKGESIATATAEKIQQVVDKVIPKTTSMFQKDEQATKQRESEKAVAAAGLSDVCPHCGKAPTVYQRWDTGWKCGDCGKVVRVSALPFEIATCAGCGAPVLDESGICNKCGSVL
jgi:ribosomal protein S27E